MYIHMYSLTSDNGVHSLQSQTLIEIKIWYRSFFVILKTAIFFTRGWDEGYSDRYIYIYTHTHTHTQANDPNLNAKIPLLLFI